MNILVINFGGIGDEIFFLPTIISLKKEFPNSKITLALEPRSKSVKDLTDKIDDLFLIDIKNKNKYFELLKLIFWARKGNFDIVISSGGNKFISILLWLTGIKKRYGYDTGKLSNLLLTQTVQLNKNQYACGMYHDLITPITKEKTYLPEIDVEPQEKIPNSVLIHPGVSKMSVQKGMIKTISADVWAQVISLLLERGKKVILAGGPDDAEVIAEIEKYIAGKKLSSYAAKLEEHKSGLKEDKQFNKNSLGEISPQPQTDTDRSTIQPFNHSNDTDLFINTYGQTKNLKDLAVLIGKAEKFLCSDSAPLHIAVAMKTKTFVIFGPTDDKKLIPQSELVTPIKADDNCPLKPCLWKHRQTTCENLDCLKISASYIVNKI